MSHLVETMAWTGDVPWHGLGVEVGDIPPDEMLRAAGLDWGVRCEPLYAKHPQDASLIKVPNRFALRRDTDGSVLSLVSEKYKPVQNAAVLDFFDKFTKAGHMKMETAGSLDHGKFIWALARIDKKFQLPGKDEVLAYLLLMQPHKVGHAMIFDMTGTRVVCWNTLNVALGSGLKGSERAFRMTHLQAFDATMQAKAEIALGLAVSQFAEYGEAADRLARVKVANDNVLEEYFDSVVLFDREAAKKAEKAEKKILSKLRNAWDSAPGQTLASANGTWWGAVNAVTYVVDHHSGMTADTRMKGAWTGEGAAMKRRALNLAIDYAKAA